MIYGQHECWWQIVGQLDHDGDPDVSRIRLLEPRTLAAKFDCKAKCRYMPVSLLVLKPPAGVLNMKDVLVRQNTWILCWQAKPDDGTRRAWCGVSSPDCHIKLGLH